MKKNILDKLQLFYIYFSITLISLFLMFYIFITYRVLFHSDIASWALLAREMIEEKNFFPIQWNYSNGDLWIPHNHVFMLPFLFLFKFNVSYFLSSLASFATTILFIFLMHLFSKIENISYIVKAFGFILILSLSPPYLVEFLYGQNTYLWVVIYFLLLCLLSALILKAACFNYKYYITLVAYVFVLFGALLSNFNRALIYYIVPLYGSVLINELVEKTEKKKIYLYLFSSIITIAFAYYSYHCLLTNLNMSYGAASIKLASIGQIQRNFNIFIEGWLSKSESFSDYYCIVILIIIILTPIIQAIYLKKIKSYLQRLLLISYIINFIIIFVFYVFTTPLAVNALTLRYFLVTIVSSIVLFLLSLQNVINNLKIKANFLSLTFIIATIPILTSSYYKLVSPAFTINDNYSIRFNKNKYDDLIIFLAKKNLKYGYASFWNSNVITVLSNETVAVRPIHIEFLDPMQGLSSNRWYSSNQYNGRSFLLLDKSELDSIMQPKYKLLGTAKEKYEFMNFLVLVYDFNVADRLNWTSNIDLGRGFYGWEGGQCKLAWSSGNSELWLINPYKTTIDRKLMFKLNTLLSRNVLISIDADKNIIEANLKLGQPQLVNINIKLEPGKTRLQFQTDTPAQLPSNSDTRKLAFSIADIEFKPENITKE